MLKHTEHEVYPITTCFSGISRMLEDGKGREETDGDTVLGSMASSSTFIGMGDVLLSSWLNNSNSEGTNWVSTSPDELSLKTSARHWAATSRPSLSTPGAVSTAQNNLTHSMNLMNPQIKQIWYTPLHISKKILIYNASSFAIIIISIRKQILPKYGKHVIPPWLLIICSRSPYSKVM